MNVVQSTFRVLFIVITTAALTLLVAVQARAIDSSTANKKPEKVIQEEFTHTLEPTLKLTHVFKNAGMEQVRLTNSGVPIKVKVNGSVYRLGTGDSLSFDPPNLSSYFIDVAPLVRANDHQPLMSTAHWRTYIVHNVHDHHEKGTTSK